MVKLMQAMAGARHGGAEAFFTRLAIALERAGQDQQVVIRRDGARAAALRRGGVAPIELGFGGALDMLTKHRLDRAVRRYHPDVVLTWMNRATMKMPRGRFVHAARLGGYYDLKYYRRCDHLIGNTPGIVEHVIAHGWPAARAHYIPNFVDTAPGRAVDRASLATAKDVPLIIALGRLHVNKAFDVLIHAMARIPDAVLWLAGDGPSQAELKSLASEIGVARRVRFLGWRDDTANLIAAADVLVCPSRHEPLGNVVIEGWAQNKPVVAAASDGPRHLISDGRDGLLCPIDDAAGLARALSEVIENPDLAARLSAAGQATFQASFTEQTVVRRYLEFFAEITA